MKKYVFDSSALIAIFNGEEGADKVNKLEDYELGLIVKERQNEKKFAIEKKLEEL